jgi:hypothetical protein
MSFTPLTIILRKGPIGLITPAAMAKRDPSPATPDRLPEGSLRIFRIPIIVAVLGYVYYAYLHSTAAMVLGWNRTTYAISHFPYDCHRIYHPELEACEDFWLDDETRTLYAACASPESRAGWTPAANRYNVSARTRRDHISVLKIDEEDKEGLFGLTTLDVGKEFPGDLDLHGFDVTKVKGSLRFWLINHRPPVDSNGIQLKDATSYGANSTVEIFDLKTGSDELRHVKTIHHKAIIAPNNLAVTDDGTSFLLTNDHSGKVGKLRTLELVFGAGSVTRCNSETGECAVALDKVFGMANGIVKGHDGRFYVANTDNGQINVLEITPAGEVTQVAVIETNMPLDNISVDQEGNLIAAGFPKPLSVPKAIEHSREIVAPGAALKIERKMGKRKSWEDEYVVSKLVEDGLAEKLPTPSIAIRDVRTGRLFISGVASPFITVCKKTE